MIKRFFDFTAAFFGLMLLLPIFLIVSLLVRTKLGSPIFFTQTRPGLNGKPFKMVKFRTMTDERDEQGNLLPDDIRLTSFGKFLRSTSLDELPELWNVLKGEMSLVGPRPLLMEYLPLYNQEQARRHEARPGITGWAQINGRNAISWEEKFAHDTWYVANQSLWLDIKILFLTVKKVLIRDGISAAGEATMTKFTGLRPGEKLFEELLIGDNVTETQHPKIMRANESYINWSELTGLLEDLNQVTRAENCIEIRKLLRKLVEGYQPQSGLVDLVHKNKTQQSA